MNLTQVVAILGGWSIIAVAVVAFVSKLANERLLSRWRRAEQKELEQLRHALTDNRILLEKSLASMATGQGLLYRRRIAAVDRLWSAVLELRDRFSGPLFFYNILQPSEYDDDLKKAGSITAASVSDLDDKKISEVIKQTEKIESDRPYFGEMLWLRFFIYRAFLARLAILIVDGRKKSHIIDWREDPGIQQILRNVIDLKQLTQLLSDKTNPFAIRIALQEIENQILKEISLLITGKQSTLESLEIAKDLQASVAKLNPYGA